MWGWGRVELDIGDLVPNKPKLVISTRHCNDCDVGWSGDTKCWMCGRYGDAGSVPLPGVIVTPHMYRTWFGRD